ncbi:hypothetical protein LC087_06845 [Bacillus carboniphilus]|uniref:Lipoprotein n=1 Tax=Bacillus carboniphilus TaxID=86663 RepID=A0ABY9JZQ9_9BACI|nr:hypothetical protein [Bacillus carboniphilus]WLR43833.1 hypothetical protein LC087_06845 [Bacillus carboniphilus]
MKIKLTLIVLIFSTVIIGCEKELSKEQNKEVDKKIESVKDLNGDTD